LIFEQRSARIAPLCAQLRAAQLQGEVHASSAELARSFAHLHAIRVLGITARSYELLIFNFLKRQYVARCALNRPHGAAHVPTL
jgi:hypothetical protein